MATVPSADKLLISLFEGFIQAVDCLLFGESPRSGPGRKFLHQLPLIDESFSTRPPGSFLIDRLMNAGPRHHHVQSTGILITNIASMVSASASGWSRRRIRQALRPSLSGRPGCVDAWRRSGSVDPLGELQHGPEDGEDADGADGEHRKRTRERETMIGSRA